MPRRCRPLPAGGDAVAPCRFGGSIGLAVLTAMARLVAIISGFVQGVGFRFFVVREARELGLGGYVRNLPSGNAVEVVAEGQRADLEEFTRRLEVGPPGAVVDRVAIHWQGYAGEFRGFEVRF